MAYYFMLEEQKGKYIPIEIDNCSIYKLKKRQYAKPGAYGLKEIDMFTTLFENEINLRIFLLNEGILKENQKDKPLSIRFYKNNTYTKVSYDFLYQKDLEFIKSPYFLHKLIMQAFNREDYLFIKKLAANFAYHYECANTATEVMWGAIHSLEHGEKDEILTRVDENNDLLISRLIKLIIYKSANDYNRRTIYKNEINYKNLHELIAFINHYYKNVKPVENIEKPKPKTKTLSKEIEGQIKINI